jgi:hypothetical protein
MGDIRIAALKTPPCDGIRSILAALLIVGRMEEHHVRWDPDERSAARSWPSRASRSDDDDECVAIYANAADILRSIADLGRRPPDRPSHWPEEDYRDHDFEPRGKPPRNLYVARQ